MSIFTRVRSALRPFNVLALSMLHRPNPSESAYTTQLGQGFSGTRIF